MTYICPFFLLPSVLSSIEFRHEPQRTLFFAVLRSTLFNSLGSLASHWAVENLSSSFLNISADLQPPHPLCPRSLQPLTALLQALPDLWLPQGIANGKASPQALTVCLPGLNLSIVDHPPHTLITNLPEGVGSLNQSLYPEELQQLLRPPHTNLIHLVQGVIIPHRHLILLAI